MESIILLLAVAGGVLLVMAALLCACGSSKAQKLEALTGTWTASDPVEADTVRELLSSMDFYEEEIALIDLNSLRDAYYVEFTPDQTYVFSYDVLGIKSNLYAFLSQAFHDMYENRTALNETYSMDFSDMSEADFQMFYAVIYEKEEFSSLLSALVEEAFYYDQLGEYDGGEFDIVGNKIDFETSSAGETGRCPYEIKGNTLTISFAEGDITFTKQN